VSSLSCTLCGRPSTVGQGLCWRCRKGIGRERGDCAGCGKPDRLLDAERRCRWCREKAANRCPDCRATGTTLTGADGLRVCDRCALRRRLEHILPAGGSGRLQPLREVILAAEPLTARRWLNRAGPLLADLDSGRIPLSHESLDALATPKAAEHLRALLIATDVLGPDPGRALRQLENTLSALLAPLTDGHRKLTTRWIRWAVLPRLRTLQGHGRPHTAVVNARRAIAQTTRFLTQLQHDNRDLGQCTQHDIDAWFAGPGAARWQVGPFLSWARQRRHLDRGIVLPTGYKRRPEAPADAEERWQVARRLVREESMDPVDRVAGALIVLYAQPLARILALRVDDVIITRTGVQLKLGTEALELPEPFATIIQQLPHRRRTSTAEQLPTRWLFAGSHADKPLTANALGNRMRAIGIQPRRFRIAAAEQLAREIPPAMLAGILGLKITAITRHTANAKGQWANYAADRHG
jgi:hypothetical protein